MRAYSSVQTCQTSLLRFQSYLPQTACRMIFQPPDHPLCCRAFTYSSLSLPLSYLLPENISPRSLICFIHHKQHFSCCQLFFGVRSLPEHLFQFFQHGGVPSFPVQRARPGCGLTKEKSGTVWRSHIPDLAVVEMRGIEPLTSCMPCRRSPR